MTKELPRTTDEKSSCFCEGDKFLPKATSYFEPRWTESRVQDTVQGRNFVLASSAHPRAQPPGEPWRQTSSADRNDRGASDWFKMSKSGSGARRQLAGASFLNERLVPPN